MAHDWLSGEHLLALRARLKAMRAHSGAANVGASAIAMVREFASGKSPATGLTVDFTAERELGHPLVVLHVKMEARPGWFGRLSPREQEVAARVALGEANKEIAVALKISPTTVKDHVHHILVKSGHSSRAQVIASFTHVASAKTRRTSFVKS